MGALAGAPLAAMPSLLPASPSCCQHCRRLREHRGFLFLSGLDYSFSLQFNAGVVLLDKPGEAVRDVFTPLVISTTAYFPIFVSFLFPSTFFFHPHWFADCHFPQVPLAGRRSSQHCCFQSDKSMRVFVFFLLSIFSLPLPLVLLHPPFSLLFSLHLIFANL